MNWVRYLFLLTLKAISLTFYRFESRWITPRPAEPWSELRVIALLNHTSLFEWLFAGVAPNKILRQLAVHGLAPVARETASRPFVGRFLKLIAPHFIPISREPDHTWREVLQRVDPQGLVVILPEGRMKRANGLDKHGQPMTVRGGIADILRALPSGRMLIAYSGGLHHVQVPGQRLPRLFKRIRIALEVVDIPAYKRDLRVDDGAMAFKRRVKLDLERRRDTYCPPLEEPPRAAAAEREATNS